MSDWGPERERERNPTGDDLGSGRDRGLDADSLRDRVVDGGLAAGALALVLGIARRNDVRIDPLAALAGGVGAVVLEWLLGRRREVVRRYWDRPAVKGGSILGLAVGILAGRRIDERRTLSAVGGGLAAYLALLGMVAWGVVDPPGDRS